MRSSAWNPDGAAARPPRSEGSALSGPESSREDRESTPAGDSRSSRTDDRICLLCGAAMYGVHCKLICPNCGYREDCSDLFSE